MILMPMGAVIFVDFWIVPRLGLERDFAASRGAAVNPAAAVAWFLTMAACTALVAFGGVQIYFVSLPGWFVAALLYLVVSAVCQRSRGGAESAAPGRRA